MVIWVVIGRSMLFEIDHGDCRFRRQPVDYLASRVVESAALPVEGAPIVADLTFLVDFTISMIAVVLPIVLIVRLLAADDDFTVGDLFMLPIMPILEPLPPEEETPARWRPELIRPRHRASEPVASGRHAPQSASPSASPTD